VNRAPHGREKSARRSREASAKRTSGKVASGPNRTISLRADQNQELLLFAPTRQVPAITPSQTRNPGLVTMLRFQMRAQKELIEVRLDSPPPKYLSASSVEHPKSSRSARPRAVVSSAKRREHV
jgi:hypothetical protein